MDNPFENARERRIIKIVISAIIGLLICGFFIWKLSDRKNEDYSTLGEEILQLSRDLYEKEIENGDIKMYTVEYQGKIKVGDNDDKAQRSLFHLTNVDQFWNQSPTIRLLKRIFDKYPMQMSGIDPEHMQVEWDFLKAIVQTPIMARAMGLLHPARNINIFIPKFVRVRYRKKVVHTRSITNESIIGDNNNKFPTFPSNNQSRKLLLRSKRYIFANKWQRHVEFLKKIWFTNSAGNINMRGSGFERVFMGTLGTQKNVVGLHNWIYFAEQERLGYLDYKGYIKYNTLGKKTQHFVASVLLTFHNSTTSQNSLFIGISPELEMSLYTACFVLNLTGKCSVELGGKRITLTVISDILKHNKQRYIVAAYPEID